MFREQLMKALDTAVKNFNGGMGDNDAVIKAAADSQFNSDQTQRLLETYNTAKSIYFFKSANDRRDRFPLADPGVVLPALFSGVAKAAPKAAGLTDQAFYSEREFHYDGKWAFDQFGARQADEASMEKAASAQGTNLSLDTLYRSLKKHATVNRQTAERCTSTADFCQYQHDESLRKLAAFVSQAYHEPDRLAQVEHYMWSLHGRDLAEPVVQDLLTCLPATSAEKRAGDRLERLPTDFEQRHPAEAALAKEAFEARFATGQLRALAVTFEKEAAGMLQQWNEIAGFSPVSEPAGSMSGFFAEALRGRLSKQAATGQSPLDQMAYPPAGQPLKAKQSPTQQPRQPRDGGGREKEEGEKAKPGKEKAPESLLSKVLAGAGTAVGGGVSKALETPIQRAMASLTSGGEAEDAQRLTGTLRNMQRKLLLEDLMVNDPVLSGEDPQSVITAYQTMVNVAPEVSLNKEIVRSVIRTAVNAVSFSPFDAKNIAELEGEMRKNLGYTLPKAEGARA
jgi:hypothetical protein